MRFISPKVDYTFKKIFGSEESEDILISFLNAIIYEGQNVIKSLTIVNPLNPGQVIDLKDTYLDVKAILADGSISIIEMQIGRIGAFNKRITYNLSKAYANQLTVGDRYKLINPVIAVTIANFILFQKTEEVINQFVFKEKKKSFEFPDTELQLVFVELPKFKKTLAELESLTDKWIYFLNDAASLQEIPESLAEVAEIEKALRIANQSNMTVEELEIAERRAIALQDEIERVEYAQEVGEHKGLYRAIFRLSKKRFGELPDAIISQIKDLSDEDLEDLTEAFLDFESIEDLLSWLERC